MCSSSDCGAASNTRRCICGPTKASARRAPRSVDISISIMAADRIRALTTPHRIKPTSTSSHSAWRPKPGRRSTYQRGDSVQTTGTSSCDQGPLFRRAMAKKMAQVNVEIVKRSDRAKGFIVLPKRWVVERTFAWLGRCRRLAKDWEISTAEASHSYVSRRSGAC